MAASVCKALSLTGAKVALEDLHAEDLQESQESRNSSVSRVPEIHSTRFFNIHSTWFFNNVVNIKLTEHGRIHKIYCLIDIENLLETDNLKKHMNASF